MIIAPAGIIASAVVRRLAKDRKTKRIATLAIVLFVVTLLMVVWVPPQR